MNEKQNPTTNESRDRDTGDAGESEKKAPENESAWTERKKKQSESARGYQWEDDGYISSPQPGQVRL